MLPTLKNTSKRLEPQTMQWAGLNKNPFIQDNQFSSTTNLSTRNYPWLSPRPSRYAAVTLSGTGWALVYANLKTSWVDGTSFKYDSTTKGSVTASSKSMVDFNGKIGIFPDKKYYDYDNDAFATMLGKCRLLKYGYDANGDIDYTQTTKIRNKNIIKVLPSTAYTLVNDKSYTVASVYYYDVNLNFISSADVNFASFTTPATCYYFNFDITGTDLTCAVSITNAVYPAETSIPAISYATTLNNRIWGVYGDNIYACAPGDINDWTTFTVPTTLASDSWTVDTGTGGDFTAICTYKNHVYAFKKDGMWKQFGDNALNFEFVRISSVGCISNKSIVEVDNKLFFLNRNGIYMYEGGEPELYSYELNETYKSGVAGGDDRYYYISLYNGSTYNLYVYDTVAKVWVQEDNTNVTEFIYQYSAAVPNGYITALHSDNKIYIYNLGSETVTMTLITKEWDENSFNKKGVSALNVMADLETSSTLSIHTRVNNGGWTLVKSAYATTDKNSFRVPITLKRANHFQLKFTMVGDGKIELVSREMYVGGKP